MSEPPQAEPPGDAGPSCSFVRGSMVGTPRLVKGPPSDGDVLELILASGIRTLATVPCSITSGWHRLAQQAHARRRLELITTTHEGNLAGLAAGEWFATGRPALLHLQNSGLGNLMDGYISMASSDVFDIPMALLVTCRGTTNADDSEPHQAIGRRMDDLLTAMVEPGAMIQGSADRSADTLQGLGHVLTVAQQGGRAVMKLYPSAFQASAVRPAPVGCDDTAEPTAASVSGQALAEALALSKGCLSLPSALQRQAPWTRDEALSEICAHHRDAAVLFCNGYTARAAQAIHDAENHFYNVGYMGGTLAIGWALARRRPDCDVVVVDGDQNAQMSQMKDHLWHQYPDNLFWYVLDNRVGASVGSAPSLPLASSYGRLARVVRTHPDADESFRHPRVRVAPGRSAQPLDARGNLAPLAQRFRDWLARRSRTES